MYDEQQAGYVRTIISRSGLDVNEADFFEKLHTITASILLGQSIQLNSSSQPAQPDRPED